MISAIATSLAARFAPSLVRRLMGDRAGEVAESILGIASRVTGAQSPEEAMAAIEAQAEFQREFAMQAAQLDMELERAYLQDRQNARDRELAMAEMGRMDWPMYLVGGVVVLGFVTVCLVAFFITDMTEVQERLISILIGMLGTGFIAVVSYYFGSSKGSKDKTSQISTMLRDRNGA